VERFVPRHRARMTAAMRTVLRLESRGADER
jgi:hypothetical protein